MSFGISEIDITHGIFRRQALEFPRVMSPMGFSVSIGISKSEVTHGVFRRQALEFPRVMSTMGFSFADSKRRSRQTGGEKVTFWFDIWFKEILQKADGPFSMNLAKP